MIMKYIIPWILLTLWLLFYLYWLFSAFKAKKSLRAYSSHIFVRVFMLILIVVLIFGFKKFPNFIILSFSNSTISMIGLIITACGLGIAIWARSHLGTNWGVPMSIKKNPELITSGPYHFVRHPIYSGVLLALLGTSLVCGMIWAIVFIIAIVYFKYSALQEEKNMTKLFPDQYSQYKKTTKTMIPFIW